jgi:tRNA splicing ligase
MNDRFGDMIRKTEDDLLSQQMARTVTERMLEIGLFANEEKKIELTMETFRLFQKFLEDFGEARRRASATILFSHLKSLREDFELRYKKDFYPKQWREVTRMFIACRSVIATIVT